MQGKLSAFFVSSFLFFLFTQNSVFAQDAEKETGAGIDNRAAFDFLRIRDLKTGKVPVNAYWQGLLKTKQAKEFYRNTLQARTVLNWEERGPYTDAVGSSNGNTRANNAVTAGRMRAVLVDASDATGKTVWVGGVDGGLWKTTDITTSPANWTLVNDYLSNIAVTSITQDPSNKDIMYFCTGEAYYNADAVAGMGVFISTDHGVTWSQLTSTINYTYCTRIVCDYQGNVYLATRGNGLLRSNNKGVSWTVITPSTMNTNICDIELSSLTGPARLHVVAGIFSTQSYRYTDIPGTATSTTGWVAPLTAFPSYAQRAEIACSGNVLYACPVNASYQVPTIYKSIDGGANWNPTTAQPTTGWASGQGWYAVSVGIDPSNSNNCIVGGLDAYKTVNGGGSWAKISNWVGTTGQYVHADIHDITWYDNGNKLLFGSDGGIHYSADKGTTIRDRNIGLRIKQFYSVAVHPTATNYFLAGAQDNGTHQLQQQGLSSSIEVTGGDGAFVAIDQNEPQYQFGAYVYNQYRRSVDGGKTWSSVNLSSSTGLFINPFDYDNINNTLYASTTAGSYLRWANAPTSSTSTNIAVAAFNSAQVSNVKVSPYTNNRVYFGTTGGRIVKVDNANLSSPAAVNITGASMPAGYVSCINVGTSDQYLIACYSNYGTTNVWVSTDAGVTWTGIDGDLPNVPVRWCMFEPSDNTKAIIATETGVWETSLINGNTTRWVPSLNFPTVRTDMLAYRSSDNTLVAATHGRGIFSTVLNSTPVCNSPSSLTTTNIGAVSATATWLSVTGVTYTVDYREVGAATWTNVATAVATSTVSITGLTAGKNYEWRVIANCLNDVQSVYATAQFTTLGDCAAPAGLTTTNISASAATLNWLPVTGAASYTVAYKLSTATTWITAAAGTTATSATITGLNAASLYNWRVNAACGSGGITDFSTAQFTTSAPLTCRSGYDNVTNNTYTGSASIPFNTAVTGQIEVSGDIDHYKFVITTGGSVTISLTNLPKNYDLRLYNSSGTKQIASSAKTGTTAETISGTFAAGTYYVRVFGKSTTDFSASLCYTLTVQTGTAATTDLLVPMNNVQTQAKIYPNPASNILNISSSQTLNEKSIIQLFDVTGRLVLSEPFVINPASISVSDLKPGVYMVKVTTTTGVEQFKFIKE